LGEPWTVAELALIARVPNHYPFLCAVIAGRTAVFSEPALSWIQLTEY